MPKQGSYPPNSIPEKALSYDTKKRNRATQGTITTINQGNAAIDTLIELGEAIEPFNAIWWGADKIAYLADIVVTNGRPAKAIAVNGGIAGDKIHFRMSDKISIIDNTLTPGNNIWLVGATPNISTRIPTYQSGLYMQKLGLALTDTIYDIQIGTARAIE